jgi:nucleotide-binding universal stress UspA family protein
VEGVRVYKRVLVPLDGSELAEVVFSYAKELAARLGLDLVLLHVASPHERDLVPLHRAYVERAAEVLRRESEEIRKKAGIRPQGGRVTAEGELAVGHAAEEILNCALKRNADLILMATHGRSGIKRWALGSVADKVLRVSEIPVCLVRAGLREEIIHDKWPTRTMLVPLDGSELAELVLPHVEALAKQVGPELVDVVLLRVCEPPVVPSDYPPTAGLTWEEHKAREMARPTIVCEEYLAGVQRRLEGAGLRAQSVVLKGKPADEITDYANKNPVSLIVMSTHGRSGISRWAYGSVADRVLLGVSSPVFLTRPPSAAKTSSASADLAC